MDRQYNRVKTGKIVAAVFFLCAAVYLLSLFFVNQRVVTVDVSGCVTDAGQMAYQIEKIESKHGFLEIRGYAYEPGISIDTADTRLLAYDPAAGVFYRLPTENVKKKKLTEKANDGFNYDYAQFKSVVRQDKLPGGCRACIWYRCNGANSLIYTDEVLFY